MDPTDDQPVLLTRSRADNARLAGLLRGRGVAVLEWPTTCVRIVEPSPDRAALLQAVEDAAIVVFSSRRGVLALRALLGRGLAGALKRRAVAAVGPSTGTLLRRLGVSPSFTGGGGAEDLGRLLATRLAPSARILLVRGEEAPDEPAVSLRAAGFVVDDRRVYRQQTPPRPEGDPRPFAAVVCASPSAARAILGWHPSLSERPFVAIGRTTEAELRRLGVTAIRVAEKPTTEALCRAVLDTIGRSA